MHEIVTLQFGPLANYVGTHFWNTQESYFTYNSAKEASIVDHDINFRAGIASDGSDTYTPRALIYDLKSGFGSLRKVNALYEIENETQKDDVWTGQQKLQTATPIVPSKYQDALEMGLPTSQLHSKDVRYWSDYNRVYYHPRSLIQLNSQPLTSQLAAFESYSAGTELFRDLDQEIGGIFDRDLRPFVEECDSLQGFQIFGACDDAWGGFLAEYVEELEEDFGKKSVWVWSLEDGQRSDRTKRFRHLTNSAQTLSNIADKVTACIRTTSVPPGLPSYVELESSSLWSTGALISSAVESVTLPTRLRTGVARGTKMAFIEDALHGESNRKMWTMTARANPDTVENNGQNGVALTDSSNKTASQGPRQLVNRDKQDQRDSKDDDGHNAAPFDLNFTPSLPHVSSVFPSLASDLHQPPSHQHIFAQYESLRTTRSSHSHIPDLSRYGNSQNYDEDTVLDIYRTPLMYPLLDSFPQNLFSLPTHGLANRGSTNGSKTKNVDKTIAIDAALSTISTTKFELLNLRDLVVGRGGRAMNLVDVNEREILYDDLTKLAENYSYGYEDDFSDGNGGQDE